MGNNTSVSDASDHCLLPAMSLLGIKEEYILNFEDILADLKNDLEDLKARRDDVLSRINAEERKGGQRLAVVEKWLSEVQTVEVNADNMVADASPVLQRLSSHGFCSNTLKVYRCGKRISQMLNEVKSLTSTEDFKVVVELAQLHSLAPEHNMEEYLHNLEKNLEALEMKVEALNEMRNELLKRVSKEKGRGLHVLPEVNGWLSMVEEIELKASGLLNKSISERQKLSKSADFSQISASTHIYSGNVRMRLTDVETLKSKGVFKVLVDRAPRLHMKKMPPPLQLTVSQEILLESTWACLMDGNVGSLGLYGMGGVGKTTILTHIKDKFLEDPVRFDLVIFVVVVSEEVAGIQDEIAQSIGILGNSKWRKQTQKQKASEISKVLNGRKYQLLLDGIQRELDLEETGVPAPNGENGCKIIFTTRSREACKSKWVDAVVKVECLSPKESWDLFQKTVGETTLKGHPDIPQLAKIVARKCRGLPLALYLIGVTMSCKKTVREWRRAIHILVSSAAEFSEMEIGFPPILKLSHDSLPSEKIRSGFLYCALFPKDINKQDLVDCWIGEGIIEEEDRETAEINGYEMIGDLVIMGLLMENESGYGVKMNGMVREMALWTASDFGRQNEHFVVKVGERIKEMPEVNDWRMVRRLSVTSTQIKNISDSPECSDLTTLFLQGNSNLKWISGEFFRWMTSLVVLNLSSNTEFCELPEEVSSLLSLQFLNLSWTRIEQLPLGLKDLKRLIHLDLDNTYFLQKIDVVGSLTNLQVLRLFQSVPMDSSLMEDIQLLKNLNELSLTVSEVSVFRQLPNSRRMASCIRRLHLKRITIKIGGKSLLNAMSNLRELYVERCYVPEITTDMRSDMIQRETAQFPNIRTVSFHGCEGLRDLTWLLLAPSLEDLRISECPQLERLISRETAVAQGYTSEQPFQNLTRLSLIGLPELGNIYWTPLPFPVLEFLKLRGCPKLRILPFNSESAKGKNVQIELDNFCGQVVFKKLDVVESLFSAGDFEVVTDQAPPHVVEVNPFQQIIGLDTTLENTRESLFPAGDLQMNEVEVKPCQQTFGLDTTLEKTWESLLKDENRMLGIYGMGGVGKSTLLSLVYKKFVEVKEDFDVVISVKVSADADIQNIQKQIGERLGLDDEDWYSNSEREKADEIYRVLSSTKPRFALLLDDLRNELSLTNIGIPLETRGKVVFTTRYMEVCGSMGTNEDIKVEFLGEKDALDLLKQNAGRDILNGEMLEHAKDIVKKCLGLPLALEVIGKCLSSKMTADEWRDVLFTFESCTTGLEGTENEIIFPVLRYSYDCLVNKDAKLCFQYCALFPEAYIIRKDELVRFWIAEGFIDEEDGSQRAKDRGYDIIGTLVTARLLLEDDEYKHSVYMHGLIREMALWIVSKFKNGDIFAVKTNAVCSQLPDVTESGAQERVLPVIKTTSLPVTNTTSLPKFHKQRIILKMDMSDNKKSMMKAMKIASYTSGVRSVSIQGQNDQLVLLGEGIDFAKLIRELNKVCHTSIISIEAAVPPKQPRMLYSEQAQPVVDIEQVGVLGITDLIKSSWKDSSKYLLDHLQKINPN